VAGQDAVEDEGGDHDERKGVGEGHLGNILPVV